MDRTLPTKLPLLILPVVVALCLASTPNAHATTIDGNPLNVYVGATGNLQARFDTSTDAVFFPPDVNLGDASLFLGFPAGALTGSVYGPQFEGAQTAASDHYTMVSQGSVTGTGTGVDPYSLQTVYKVDDGLTDYLRVTQVVTYVDGDKKFKVSYAVQNVTSPAAALRFRASAAADLYIEGSDFGTGLLAPGPPRFVAGANHAAGRAGGIVEVPGSEWDAYEVGYYDDIWATVGDPFGSGFDNSLEQAVVDNGVGVQWDDYQGAGQGLEGGATATFEAVWRFAVVVPLALDPVEADAYTNRAHKITVTATDVTGNPMTGKTVRYKVSGVNSGSAGIVTDSSGKAVISYVGTHVGDDGVTVFVDLNNDGTRQSNEPQVAATVHWKEGRPPGTARILRIGRLGRFTASKDGKVDVMLTCPSSAGLSGCEGDLAGRLTVRRGRQRTSVGHGKLSSKQKQRVAHAAGTKKKPNKHGTGKYELGPAHYQVEVGKSGIVTVVLKPEALARLKKAQVGIVSFTARSLGQGPQSVIGTIRASR